MSHQNLLCRCRWRFFMKKQTVNINHRHNCNYRLSRTPPWTQHSFLTSIADLLWLAITVPFHWSNRGRAATTEPMNQVSHLSHRSLLWFWPAMDTAACEATGARLVYRTSTLRWSERKCYFNSQRQKTQDREHDNQLHRELSNNAYKELFNILRLYWDQSTLHWCSF